MVTNKTHCYGIKYKVVKINQNNYFLFPISLVGGLSDNNTFSTGFDNYQILKNKNNLSKSYLISNVFYTSDLEKMYKYDEDTNLLGKFYFEDNSKKILYVEILPSGSLKIHKMDLEKYSKAKIHDANVTYYFEDGEA